MAASAVLKAVDESNVWDNPSTDGVTALNLYNQAFVDTVRSTGANNARRNLVCCTYAASCSERCMRAFRLPKDSARDHLIAEVHMYNPSGFAFRDEDVTWEPTVSRYSTTVEQTVDCGRNRERIWEYTCDYRGVRGLQQE